MGESDPVEKKPRWIVARALCAIDGVDPDYVLNGIPAGDIVLGVITTEAGQRYKKAGQIIAALESAGLKIMGRDPTKEMDRAVTRYTGKAYVFQTMWDAAPAYGTPAPETKNPPPA